MPFNFASFSSLIVPAFLWSLWVVTHLPKVFESPRVVPGKRKETSEDMNYCTLSYWIKETHQTSKNVPELSVGFVGWSQCPVCKVQAQTQKEWGWRTSTLTRGNSRCWCDHTLFLYSTSSLKRIFHNAWPLGSDHLNPIELRSCNLSSVICDGLPSSRCVFWVRCCNTQCGCRQDDNRDKQMRATHVAKKTGRH